jgi:uncharacterized alkaline shock family protein YloU
MGGGAMEVKSTDLPGSELPEEDMNKEQSEMSQADNVGALKVSDDVIAIIAGITATDVPGVAGMTGGTLAGGISEMLGKKNLAKGVRVAVTNNEIVIDLFIIVDFGSRIPDVAFETQSRVKKTIESMVGMKVTEVNIHVQGIYIEKDVKEPKQ